MQGLALNSSFLLGFFPILAIVSLPVQEALVVSFSRALFSLPEKKMRANRERGRDQLFKLTCMHLSSLSLYQGSEFDMQREPKTGGNCSLFYRQYCFLTRCGQKGLGTRRPHQYSCAIGS